MSQFKQFNDFSIDSKLLASEQHNMILSGFSVDITNNIYICCLGAFIKNISIDTSKEANGTVRNEFLELLKNEGYDLIVGPPSPNINGKLERNEVGIYCKNYLDILEKEARKSSYIKKIRL